MYLAGGARPLCAAFLAIPGKSGGCKAIYSTAHFSNDSFVMKHEQSKKVVVSWVCSAIIDPGRTSLWMC